MGLVGLCLLMQLGVSLAIRKELPDDYGSALGQILRFAWQQLYVAPPNATVPTPTALRFNFGTDTYKLEKCARKDVASCLYYGEHHRSILLQSLEGSQCSARAVSPVAQSLGVSIDVITVPCLTMHLPL